MHYNNEKLIELENQKTALLGALEKVTESFATVCENCDWLESDFPAIQKARTAIAAAKGEA